MVDCAESCRIQNPLMNSPESAGQIACFTVLKCVLRSTLYGNGKKRFPSSKPTAVTVDSYARAYTIISHH